MFSLGINADAPPGITPKPSKVSATPLMFVETSSPYTFKPS